MHSIKQRLIPPRQGIRASKFIYIHRGGIRVKRAPPLMNQMGICWHWTANSNVDADAEAYHKLWHNATEGAHFVLDDKQIIQCAPDNELIYHTAGGTYATAYAKKKYPRGANVSLIGVEICVQAGHSWAETYKQAVWLGATKCIEYGWDPHLNFERHFDMTGKNCPDMWTHHVTGGDAAWEKFKQDVVNLILEIEKVVK